MAQAVKPHHKGLIVIAHATNIYPKQSERLNYHHSIVSSTIFHAVKIIANLILIYAFTIVMLLFCVVVNFPRQALTGVHPKSALTPPVEPISDIQYVELDQSEDRGAEPSPSGARNSLSSVVSDRGVFNGSPTPYGKMLED